MMNKLLFCRRLRRMTQQELAEAAGVSRRTICYLEQGEHLPTLRVGMKLCRALGRSFEEVFADVLL